MHKWQALTVADVEEKNHQQSFLILDMRSIKSYLAGHYPQAIHLDSSLLRTLLKNSSHNLPILIYCDHGNESQDTAQLFIDFGFENIAILKGGYDAWFQPTQKPTAPLSEALLRWLAQNGFRGQNLDYRSANNETALMVAARQNNLWVVEQLIEAGASVNLLNADGNNALWMASLSNALNICSALIRADIDVDNQNDNGATAFIYAASTANQPLLDLLINAEANPTLTTHDGFGAVDVAGDLPTLKYLKHLTSLNWFDTTPA